MSTVVLGGSIAMGHGTQGWPDTANGTFGAITQRWLLAAFPAAGVPYHNGAVGATPSGARTTWRRGRKIHCLVFVLDPIMRNRWHDLTIVVCQRISSRHS